MSRYRRARVLGASYFFTVNLRDRRSDLLVRHIDLLRDTVRATRERHPFHIDAWVVLPDHMHCLWTLPENDDDFALRWKVIKFAFARRLPNIEQRSATQRKRGERGIWQRRYWEHLIRDDLDFERHIDYIHFNPVKHGHVQFVADWPYSSFHRAVRHGLLPIGWGRARGDAVDDRFGERLQNG
jgi:putative transposase